MEPSSYLNHKQIQQLAGGRATHLLVWDRHGGERWGNAVNEGHVVVSGYREVAGNRNAPLGKGVVAAEGDEVVCGNDGGEVPTGVEQAITGRPALLGAEGASLDDQLGVSIGTLAVRPLHGCLSAGQSGGGVLRSCDVCDRGVTQTDEVANHQADPGVVITNDCRKLVRRRRAVH